MRVDQVEPESAEPASPPASRSAGSACRATCRGPSWRGSSIGGMFGRSYGPAVMMSSCCGWSPPRWSRSARAGRPERRSPAPWPIVRLHEHHATPRSRNAVAAAVAPGSGERQDYAQQRGLASWRRSSEGREAMSSTGARSLSSRSRCRSRARRASTRNSDCSPGPELRAARGLAPGARLVGRLLSARAATAEFGNEPEAEVALGENFPVLALRQGRRPITLGFGSQVYGRFSLADRRARSSATTGWSASTARPPSRRWAFTLELYHESSHLGDEYERSVQRDPARLDQGGGGRLGELCHRPLATHRGTQLYPPRRARSPAPR